MTKIADVSLSAYYKASALNTKLPDAGETIILAVSNRTKRNSRVNCI